MKKFFSIVALALLAFACGPVPNEVESNVGITAPDGYAVACYTGYTRTTPHYCADTTHSSASYTATSVELDGTCRNFDISTGPPVLPTSVKFLQAQVAVLINSGNVIGIRQISMSFYWDASCTTFFGSLKQSTREEVAVAAGTELLNPNFQVQLPVLSQKVYYKGTTTGGVNSVFTMIPLGYFD